MSPPTEPRRCANPACREDISDLRADAEVCRRKACLSWRDRRRAQGRSLYSPCTRSCPALGWCHFHGRFNRRPRRVSAATGRDGKRVRSWSDPDHVGKPGLWEIWSKSLPGQFPQFERAHSPDMRPARGVKTEARKGIPPERWQDEDPNKVSHVPGPEDAYIAPPDGLWLAGRLEPTSPRLGIEALRQAVAAKRRRSTRAADPEVPYEVDVTRDGWVTVGQEVDTEPDADDLDDLSELREVA